MAACAAGDISDPSGSQQHSRHRHITAARMRHDGHGPSHGDLCTPGNRTAARRHPDIGRAGNPV